MCFDFFFSSNFSVVIDIRCPRRGHGRRCRYFVQISDSMLLWLLAGMHFSMDKLFNSNFSSSRLKDQMAVFCDQNNK